VRAAPRSARAREGMRAAKVLMEQQLQETAGELVAAERELAARPGGEPAALHPAGGAACIGLPGPGALPQPGSASGGDEEALVGALRAENDAIMQVPRPGAPVSPRPESASTHAGEACMPPRLSSCERASGRVSGGRTNLWSLPGHAALSAGTPAARPAALAGPARALPGSHACSAGGLQGRRCGAPAAFLHMDGRGTGLMQPRRARAGAGGQEDGAGRAV
jgi:hypothetical protein